MNVFKIHPEDTVAVAVKTLHEGEIAIINGETIPIHDEIPAGHKFALRDIEPGEKIMKYGWSIGHASSQIPKGCWVHTHNLVSDVAGAEKYAYSPSIQDLQAAEGETFQGYVRSDGSVGIRNEVWIIPTVGCVNGIASELEKRARELDAENVDGIYAYQHPHGCSQLGDDMSRTLQALAGLVNHPNAAAVLVLGLGCENGNITELQKVLRYQESPRVRFLNCQDETDEIEKGVSLLRELIKYANGFRRETCPLNALKIGLKCGGSDGFSGITANPLLGAFSDMLLARGGSTILTEVPEMFGAERILMNRCRTKEIFEKTVSLINGFKAYFERYGQKTDENPSTGNKAGGISTLAEKSLGCTQKAGSAPVEDVLKYGEQVRKCGLSLLEAPGNDLVASAAEAISGAQLVLFTTGRGTPFGCPVPTIKISSNSMLAEKKKGWIDFDAGKIAEGADVKELAKEFYAYVMRVVSGQERCRSEAMDKRELAIFKDGVTE